MTDERLHKFHNVRLIERGSTMLRRLNPAIVILSIAVLALGTYTLSQTVQSDAPDTLTQQAGQDLVLTGALDLSAADPDDGIGTQVVNQVLASEPATGLSTVQVVKNLTPSVVQILTEIPSMQDFNQPTPPGMGVGTGVILDTDGNILTNNHVIADAQRMTVTLSNGDTYLAELVGGDVTTDLAVVRIRADGLIPARLGNSSVLQVGEDVIAIGHALGLPGGPTVSKGVVSALSRTLLTGPQSTMVDLIQTDASINPGNSGGPLLNTRAEVIGINTAGFQGSQGIGFAINIDDAKVIVAQLLDDGHVRRGGLGISPGNLNPGIANQLGLSVSEGILVVQLLKNSAAEEAGLQEGDVIVQLGDEPISNTGDMSEFLLEHLPGDTVTAVYFRGSTKITTDINLTDRGPDYGGF